MLSDDDVGNIRKLSFPYKMQDFDEIPEEIKNLSMFERIQLSFVQWFHLGIALDVDVMTDRSNAFLVFVWGFDILPENRLKTD